MWEDELKERFCEEQDDELWFCNTFDARPEDVIDFIKQLLKEQRGNRKILRSAKLSVDLDNIQPCPFCGSEQIRLWQTEDEYWHIQCNDEPQDCTANIYDFETRDEAMNYWNRIKSTPEPGEL